jgi:hypothetical protein
MIKFNSILNFFLLNVIVLTSIKFSIAQNCNITNKAFKAGEELNYHIEYNWGPFWVEAGKVSFTVNEKEWLGKTYFNYKGVGSTYPKYDWFFKVRDRYESYTDTSTLKPVRFLRDVSEGSNYYYEENLFFPSKNKVYTYLKKGKKEAIRDTVAMKDCTFDVLSLIYYSRNIDFSNYKVNDTIPLKIFLDNEVHEIYIRYLGKEIYKSPYLGTFNCIKFSAMLIEGTIFKSGEHMKVYVTDDLNKIPLYIESKILVGNIKVYLKEYKNLRNNLTSKKD